MTTVGCIAAVFDLFHEGHIEVLKKCKSQCDYLIVGLHNDETVEQYKRIPIMSQNERQAVVEACKYVDEVLTDMPLIIDEEFILMKNIDVFFYATVSDEEDKQYNAKYFKFSHEKLAKLPYTHGISTTDIITRCKMSKIPNIKQDPWGHIWHQKGLQKGDARFLNGWEGLQITADEVYTNIKTIMNIKSNERVLEVGCGAGYLGKCFNPKIYTGIDYSETLIAKFKDIFHGNAYICEANNLPFEDNSFEHVFIFSSVQYFPDTVYLNQVLAELNRVAIKTIFIGDLREGKRQDKDRRHTEDIIKTATKLEHFSCPKAFFENSGYSILEPWFEDYGVRYNVIKKLTTDIIGQKK
tara:strand:+ start:3536 stop:4594 length:1059 start_codon:yes stop_codon:yes gene_type:complete